MIRAVVICCFAVLIPLTAGKAQSLNPSYEAIIERSINDFILPRYARLGASADQLQNAAQSCGGEEAELRSAYHAAFDAWIEVSHIRLGPSEENDAAFAIAFWPDPKGFTAKSLKKLIATKDPVIENPATFQEVSIASRGFFALERLLFDQSFADLADGYRCKLVGAITHDLKRLSDTIEMGWLSGYADVLRGKDETGSFSDDKEAVRALYSTLKTGAEFTMTARIDRPLGSNDRPRPKRAEAWRSGRSNRNIILSINALSDMFEVVFAPEVPKETAEMIRSEFDYVRGQAEALTEPLLTAVADPLDRGRVITLRFSIEGLLEQFDGLLRPSLALSLSFNTLDGD